MIEELKGIKWNKIEYEEAMKDISELNDRYPGYPFPQYEDKDMVIIVSKGVKHYIFNFGQRGRFRWYLQYLLRRP